MQSRADTITVPTVIPPGTGQAAVPAFAIVMEMGRPQRVLVRNISLGDIVAISYSAASLQTGGVSDTFQLPPGVSEVFIVQPNERLHAASAGTNAMITYAMSDAVPIGRPEK